MSSTVMITVIIGFVILVAIWKCFHSSYVSTNCNDADATEQKDQDKDAQKTDKSNAVPPSLRPYDSEDTFVKYVENRSHYNKVRLTQNISNSKHNNTQTIEHKQNINIQHSTVPYSKPCVTEDIFVKYIEDKPYVYEKVRLTKYISDKTNKNYEITKDDLLKLSLEELDKICNENYVQINALYAVKTDTIERILLQRKKMKELTLTNIKCDHQIANTNALNIISNWSHNLNLTLSNDIINLILYYNKCRTILLLIKFKSLSSNIGGCKKPMDWVRPPPKQTITGSIKSSIQECQLLLDIANFYQVKLTPKPTKYFRSTSTRIQVRFEAHNGEGDTIQSKLDYNIPLFHNDQVENIENIVVWVESHIVHRLA